jgi:hypothetical protein
MLPRIGADARRSGAGQPRTGDQRFRPPQKIFFVFVASPSAPLRPYGGADLLSYFSYPGLIPQRARSPQSGKTGRSGSPVSRASGTPWATIFRA